MAQCHFNPAGRSENPDIYKKEEMFMKRGLKWYYMMKPVRMMVAVFISIAFVLSSFTTEASAAGYDDAVSGVFTFTEEGISASGESGFKISGTSLTINEAGTYMITGSCSEGNVKVKKGTTGVTLILSDLSLACSTTAPVAVNKECGQTVIILDGHSSLTDSETDETLEDYEGAAIKVKNGSSLIIKGDGILDVNGVTKNGIKGGSEVDITVEGGTINIASANNALASDNSVSVTGGTINITAADDGIKSEPDEDDTTSLGNISISGGNISVTCTDDAIHASENVDISGGILTINAGDDGVHADTALTIGTEGSTDKYPMITVESSYEGLEAGNVYIYSGTCKVNSSDDGINAAGGSTSGSDPGMGGGNTFNPGGRPGGSGRFTPGSSTASGDYAIYIYGGNVYVKAGGDGIDSNGPEYLYGGNVVVWGAASNSSARDNSPLDADGSIVLKGATVFAAGSGQMAETPASDSQNYVKSTSTISSGSGIYVKDKSGNTVYATNAIEQVNYVLYSSPELASGASISSGAAVDEKDDDASTDDETSGDDASADDTSTDDTSTDDTSTDDDTSADDDTSTDDDTSVDEVSVAYRTYVQKNGWMGFVTDGTMSGTAGKSLRLEGIQIKLSTDAELSVNYKTYCQTYGWLSWSKNGQMNGTKGEAKRLEAIRIKLSGADADKYDIYYRVHAQSYGWLDWAKNGQIAGTMGLAKRLEAIQIVVVPKGSEAPASSYKGIRSTQAKACYKKNG